VFANGFTQEVSNVKYSNATLLEVFESLKEQTGYGILYKEYEISSDVRVNMSKENSNVQEVLDEALEGTGLDYIVQDEVIVIYKTKELPEPIIENTEQEKKLITGKVVDEKGQALPFAAVCFKGTTTGCVAAVDGTYTLEVIDEEGLVLEISSLGYITKVIPVEGRSVINIVLEVDIANLGEVVVTGYQTIEKGRATGSFVLVGEEDINNITSVQLSDRLTGVASGLLIDSEGKISIRGISTLRAENEPLIVVDGFPHQGSINDINPNDIDQISVLKDAASTAIYGIKGANGVIVITTKTGKKTDELEIRVNSMVRISQKPDYADLGYMSAAEQVDYSLNIFDQYGTNYPGGSALGSRLGTIGEFYQQQKDGLISEAEANAIYDFYRQSNDIEKYLLKRTLNHKHDVSFSHGTEKNQFYASISYDDQDYFSGTSIDEQNVSLVVNDKMRLNKFVDFGINIRARHTKNENGLQGLGNLNAYTRFYDESGNYINDFNGNRSVAELETLESLGALSHFNNALQNERLTDNSSKRNQVISSFNLTIKPIKGLSWSNSYNYSFNQTDTKTLYDQQTYYARSIYNQYLNAATGEGVIPYGNILKEKSYQRIGKTYRSQLNFDKQFGDFRTSFIGGFERNEFSIESPGTITRYNYNDQALNETYVQSDGQGFGNIYGDWTQYKANEHQPNREEELDRFQSVYVTGSVSYKDRYNVFGSWRKDETNLFGQSAQYREQPSWSAGIKWTLSDEAFLDVDWLNYLSFKTSYGLSGRIDKTTSPYLVVTPGYDFWTGYKSNEIRNPENPLLGWEKSYTFNTGFDFRIFNRIGGSIEYYHIVTKDVLALTQLDPTNGFPTDEWTKYYTNNGEILNHGFDVSLNANLVSNNNFKYDATLNFSYNYNEVSDMDIDNNDLTLLGYDDAFVKGQPIDYVHAVNSNINENGEIMITKKDGSVVSGSEFATFDINDLDFYRKTPPVFGSLNNQIQYKRWSLGVLFTYEFGHKVKMYTNNQLSGVYGFKNGPIPRVLNNAWSTSNTDSNIPEQRIISDGTAFNAHANGNWNISSADNVQLKSLNLTYDLGSIIKLDFVKELRLNANVENLWNWSASDYDRLTPIGTFPMYKTYTFTLNAKF